MPVSKRKKKTLLLSTTILTALNIGTAQAAGIASMSITGGSYFVAGVTPSPVPFTYIGPNTNLVGGYIGAGVDSPTFDPSSPVSFNYFGAPVNTYTAAMNLGSQYSTAGTLAGGPAPSGDITGGVITMDLSSWFHNWFGMDFHSGGTATGSASCVGTSCTFSNLTWNAVLIGGTTHGFTANWTLNGTATVVPIPATLWLFGSGLLGLLGFMRRRPRGSLR